MRTVLAAGTKMTSIPPKPSIRPPETPRGSGLYATPGDALKAVKEDYDYWTGKLTESSFQLSFAVIAANWAVFSTVEDILSNPWVKWSFFFVLLCLAINLLGAKRMGELHRKRVDYAESDLSNWEKEFSKTKGKRDPWPSTKGIDNLGRLMRELKAWLPIAAGLFFLIALFCS